MVISRAELIQVITVYDYTLEDVAALLNVSEGHVCNVVNGKKRFTERLANRLVTEMQLTDAKLQRIKDLHAELSGVRGN
ncbi:MAG: hypothetical protein ACQET8_02125 [Bacillota bacterium]